MTSKIIKFSRHTVTKSAAPDLMRVEVEKTRRAFYIGKECGLFYVPNVLDFDKYNGVAVFERLDGIEPIRTAISWGKEYNAFADRLGTALAIIHRKLTLPSDMIIPLPTELNFPKNEIFFHGDLSVHNVCISKYRPSFVILDWQMTSVYGGQATYGTRYFDLLWFINNLFNRPTIRYLFGNPVIPVVRRFLDAYCKEACFEYDSGDFSLYAKNFFSLVKLRLRGSRLGWRRRILLPRSDVMIRKFIQLIPELANMNKCSDQNVKKHVKEQHYDSGL